ncbi:MAG: hypothetical protein ACKO5C_00250 [Ferruginibacter sp.]
MIKVLVQIALFYLIYKFIQYFVVPIIKTAKDLSVKSEAMRQASKKQEKAAAAGSTQSGTKRPPHGEYIDFEEIK